MTALGLGLQVALLLGAGAASLQVEPNAPCVTQAGLAQRLEAAGYPVRPGVLPRVEARARGGALELRITWSAQQQLDRTIPAAAKDCAAVERVAVTLITTWLQAPPRPAPRGEPAPASAQRAPAAEPAPSPSASPGLVSDPPAPTPLWAPAPDVEDFSRAASAASPRSPEGNLEEVDTLDAGAWVGDADSGAPELLADAGSQGVDSDAVAPDAGLLLPPPAADAGSSWSLRVAVLGGVAGGQTPQGVAAGAASVELGGRIFSAGIEAGLEQAQTRTLGSGRIAAAHQWLGLYASARLRVLRLWFELALGVRGWRIEANASGFSDNRTAVLLGAGPSLALGARVHLVGPLSLALRTAGSFRLPEERLRIDPSGSVVVLRSWELGALAGLVAEIP